MPAPHYPEEVHDDDDGTMPANVAALAEAVVGHKIVAVHPNEKRTLDWGRQVTSTRIVLDDGTSVYLADTNDCCAFTELESFLLNVDKINHIITGVGTTDCFTTWHIFADFGDVMQMKVGWSAGNPFYYGYGFDITVEKDEHEHTH